MLCLKRLPVGLLLLLTCQSLAQPSRQFTLDSLAGQLIRNARLNQNEQSFITSDRSVYKAGENIWVRAFLLQSESQKISTNSKSLIVDLVNEQDSAIRQFLFNSGEQQLSGKLETDIFLPSGFYWLRAYTPHMTGEHAGKIYSRPLYLVNPSIPDGSIKQSQAYQSNANDGIPQLSFYPEGGTTITGAASVIGFRSTDKSGKPIAVSGIIKDNRDSIVTRISTDQFGLGRFEFFPYRARKYLAVINHGEKEFSFALPAHNFFAGQLSVTSSQPGNKKIRVLLEDSLYRKDYITYLIGISKDSLCFASIGRGNYEVNIQENQFPQGVATLLLVDENLRPLSKRNFYIRKGSLQINAKTDKQVYRKRDKGMLSIVVSGKNNLPVAASLSVSMADARLIESRSPETIVNEYFQQLDEKLMNTWILAASEELSDSLVDLLMLTNNSSYKHFDALADNNISGEDSLLFIRGKVLTQNGQPVGNKVVTLFAQGQGMVFETATTNAEGKFVFPLTEYVDSTRFNVQVSNGNGKAENLAIIIDDRHLPRPEQSNAKPTFTISPIVINQFSKSETNNITELNDATEILKGKSNDNKSLEEYIESKRISHSSHIISATAFDKGGDGNLRNAIMGVPGMTLMKGFLTIRGHSSQLEPSALSEPLVVLNGLAMQLSGGDISNTSPVLNFLSSLNTDDIDFIEILKGPEGATFGVRSSTGVILVNTSAPVREAPNNNAPVKTFFAHGYHMPSIFQTPRYEKQAKASTEADRRSTHYWMGNMITDASGKLEIPFYTSDIPGTYKVVIKGITAKGDIIHKSFTYTVQ